MPALAFLCIGLQTSRAEILQNGNLETFVSGQPSSWDYLYTGGGDGMATKTNGSSPFTNIYPAGTSSLLLADGPAYNSGPGISQSFSSVSGTVNLSFDFKLSAMAGDPWLILPTSTHGLTSHFLTNIRVGGSDGTFSIGNAGSMTNISPLSAGTWYQVSTTLDLANSKYSGSITTYGGSSTMWTNFNLRSDVHDLTSITIEDAVFAAATNGAITVDNFSLSASNASVVAVPETSTWVMGFLALGAVTFLIRRKSKGNHRTVGLEIAALR